MTNALSRPKLWLIRLALGSETRLLQPFQGLDWARAIQKYESPGFAYPDYYRRNYHGLEGGYLSPLAAITYDPITAKILVPGEMRVRRAFVKHVSGILGDTSPRQILELATGTGSTTMLWRRAFAEAEISGIDLSPYMLVAAERKLAGQNVALRLGRAEATGFAANSFDLIVTSLLFHEIPAAVARQVVEEAYRLLKPGGVLAVLDGNQKSNFMVRTVAGYFPEPYFLEYMNSDLGQMYRQCGFKNVHSGKYLGLYQMVTGFK
ncbi:MAG TPA: class I SAM-dependent methyltransferase [Chloroflexia bacterium]|nr:class I SAM-dependent methyltransferase [Chloroflexia bacterium]